MPDFPCSDDIILPSHQCIRPLHACVFISADSGGILKSQTTNHSKLNHATFVRKAKTRQENVPSTPSQKSLMGDNTMKMNTKTKINLIKILSVIAFVATITINILANALPLGGFSTGQISAMYPTLFTPPGFTFAIWGLIYGLLGVFLVIQLISRTADDLADISPYFLLSCIFNIAWLITWHNQMIVLATVSILLLLASLLRIYFIVKDRGFVTRITFSIYYAWITVASIISFFVLVKTLTGGAPVTPIQPRSGLLPGELIIIGGNPEIVSYVSNIEYALATFAALLVGPLTALHILRRSDYAYALTIIWAVVGIMYKNLTAFTPPVFMLITASISAAMILLAAVWQMFNGKNQVTARSFQEYLIGDLMKKKAN